MSALHRLRSLALLGLLASMLPSCTSDVAAEASSSRGREVAWSFVPAAALGEEEGSFEVVRGKWVYDDGAGEHAGTLRQDARNASSAFNVALSPETARDLELSVSLRSLSGEIDRGGGLVWRARDGENYYVARFNPLEDNFRVYTVVGGVRTQLASADATVEPDAWCTLSVRMVGDHMVCMLDGEKLLDVRDRTFLDGGRVGLWTKADARTEFDGLVLRER